MQVKRVDRVPARPNRRSPTWQSKAWNGVTQHVSEIRLGQIEDGTSKTLCVGEKYLNVDEYNTGTGAADDQHFWCGVDRDVNNYVAIFADNNPINRADGNIDRRFVPERDRPGQSFNWKFGGPHEAGWLAVFVDGHVELIGYGEDMGVVWAYGGRRDGSAALNAVP